MCLELAQIFFHELIWFSMMQGSAPLLHNTRPLLLMHVSWMGRVWARD